MNETWRVVVASLLAIGIGLFGAGIASAERYTSPSYTIDASVGNSFGGSGSSTSYKLVSSGGESIIGNGSGGSYILGEGYVAQLDKALQLIVQPSGLSAYYAFEEQGGAAIYDESSNVYHGNLTGSPTRGAGKVGNGLSFNGSSQYGSTADIDISTNITVEAWVNPTSGSQTAKLVSKSSTGTDSQGTLQLVSGAINFVITTNATQRSISGAALSTGTWSHVVGTYDGANVKLYVNGVQASTTAATGAIATNNYLYTFGKDASASSGYFNGGIDEVKIFSRAMSANEVKAEYDAGVAGNAAGISFAGNLVAGTSSNTAAQAIVQTDAPGYTLMINQNQNLTSGASNIPVVNNSGNIATPAAWTESTTKGLGFTLTSASATALPGKWGTNPNYAYAAVPGSATSFYTRTGYTAGGKDSVALQYRVDVTSLQPSGSYTNTVTYTGMMTP